MASQLLPQDESGFKAAGLLLCRNIKGHACVLLGKQAGGYALLGGSRDLSESSLMTALREFHEETAGQLHLKQHAFVGYVARNAQVIWVGGQQTNAKYALYVVDMDSSTIPMSISHQLESLCQRFASFRGTPSWHRLPHTYKETDALSWVVLDGKHLVSPKVRQSPFLAKVLVECEPLRNWLAGCMAARN